MMPQIDFCFSGWVRGAKITRATDVEGKKVDVSKMESSVLASKLTKGELFISLGDYLYDNRDNEIEMFDFEENRP
jgi:hypothetical protein